MKSKILLLIILFTIVTFAQQNKRYINVLGRAEMNVQADMISSRFEIRIIKQTLEESKNINQKITQTLFEVLKKLGIKKNDIEITPLIFGKNYSYKQQERIFNGFYSYTSVNVRVKDFDNYYKLIDKATGIEFLEMSYSNFGLAKKDFYTEKITNKAILSAKKKAEYIAKTMGVKLGKILEIDELDSDYGFAPVNSYSKMDRAGQEMAGSVKLSKNVRVKYQIAD